MSKPYVSETTVSRSAEQLKAYWRMLGRKLFIDRKATMLANGYFMITARPWRTVDVYNNQAQSFIERLMIADTPDNTFHVFANGYMATAKDNGFLDIYAPNGSFFATRQQRVRCFGQLSSYVYIKEDLAYLADITGQKEDFLLGNNADILHVEQNINGLVAVNRRNAVELYNEKMERISPVENMCRVLFFDCGSLLLGARGQDGYRKDHFFNAELKCLIKETSYSMDIIDYDCFSINQTLYDAVDGSVINTEGFPFSSLYGKPVHTSVGKFFAKNNQLLDEKDDVVLGFFPEVRELEVFAGHFVCFCMKDRFLVFDLALSAQETKQAISEVLSEYSETEDIPQGMFDYFKHIIYCLEKTPLPYKKMLNGLLAN